MRALASTGEIRGTSGAAPGGKSCPRRSTPGWDSQLYAEETRRPGTTAPRSLA